MEGLDSVDLLRLAEDYTQLRRAGREYVGLCPLHQESSPSFYVDPENGVWYCFGCGQGGDAIDLVRLVHKVDFREAVEIIARRFNLVLRTTPEQQKAQQRERSVQDVLAEAVQICARALLDSPAAEYLEARGIDITVARQAAVGWAGPEQMRELAALQRRHGIENFSILACDRYPDTAGPGMAGQPVLWARRVVVPMMVHRRVVNVYSRAVDDVDVRYKHRYLTGRPKGLFGGSTRPRKRLVVVEGAFDWLACLTAGLEAVGVGGASRNPPEGLVRRLARLAAGVEVVVMMDADPPAGEEPPPGQQAALELAAALAAVGAPVRIADLTAVGGGDPNDVLLREGPDALREAADNALSMVEFADLHGLQTTRPLLERVEGSPALRRGKFLFLAESYSNKDPAGIRAVVTVKADGRTLAKDQVALWSQVSRKRLINAVGLNGDARDILNQTLIRLDEELAKLIAEEVGLAEEKPARPEMTEEERAEAEAFLEDPAMIERILEDVHALGVVGEDIPIILLYLTMTSRLMDDPLFVCIKASSSSGKSFLAGTVASLCPPEDLRDLTRITPKALYHVPQDWAKHKLLIIRERVGAEDTEADYSIRTMLSEKGLHLLCAEKMGDEIVAHEKVVDGPLAYVETTTALDINPENQTRLYECYLDESPSQTAAIQERQRELVLPSAMRLVLDREEIRRRHHNAQRLLQRGLQVAIPYAHLLEFPAERPRHRRDHQKFLKLIQAVAFLHQKQREVHTIEVPGGRIQYIEASVGDYAVAYWLASELLVPMLMELDERSRQLYEAILQKAREKLMTLGPSMGAGDDVDRLMQVEFTMRDFYPLVPYSKYQVRECVRNLVMADFLTSEGSRPGQTYRYRIAFVADDPRASLNLLTPPELEERIAAAKADGNYEHADTEKP